MGVKSQNVASAALQSNLHKMATGGPKSGWGLSSSEHFCYNCDQSACSCYGGRARRPCGPPRGPGPRPAGPQGGTDGLFTFQVDSSSIHNTADAKANC